MYVGRSSYSSFGMYDAMFLWMMLDHMDDRRYQEMAYNRSTDPGMVAWREEANKLAADNEELRVKLATMDAQLVNLDGAPKNPDYLPDGVDPSIIVASNIVEEEIPEKKNNKIFIVICIILAFGIIFIAIVRNVK